MADRLFRRPFKMRNTVPLISFTFDDFPASALVTGGGILRRHCLAGTYYASFGLMGRDTPTGQIFSTEELKLLFEQGHELGCHTFGHCDGGATPAREFERSIIQNLSALRKLRPDCSFKTLSYPINCPRPYTKRLAAKHFLCCRCGGQSFNSHVADLSHLRAFFIEKTDGDFAAIKRIVDENRLAGGWLIFATHDVTRSPTRYGCTPDYFERTIDYSLKSGARIVTVSEAIEVLKAPSR